MSPARLSATFYCNWIAGGILTLAVLGGAKNHRTQLYPIDEAEQDSSLVRFRTRVVEIVQARDAVALTSVLDAGVRSSFGGEGGIPEFQEFYGLNDPTSVFWTDFERVLSLGGAFVPGELPGEAEFCAPYVAARFQDRDDDHEDQEWNWVAVLGEQVVLHAGPQASARPVGVLTYDIVRVLTSQPWPEWLPIDAPSVGRGFVHLEDVRSPFDYRAYFTRRGGRWVISAFVGGD